MPQPLTLPLHPLPLQDERRPSLWTSYINSASNAAPQPSSSTSSSISPVSRLSSVVKKLVISPPSWKKRKNSDHSWVQLETHAVGVDEEQQFRHIIGDDEEAVKDGERGDEDEEKDTIRFDRGGSLVGGLVLGGGASGGLLRGESRSPRSRVSSYGQPSFSSPSTSAYPNRNFVFGDRRSSSAPKPPNPTLRSPPPNYSNPSSNLPPLDLPRRQSRPPPPQATREELLQAERERRAAEHRIKMQLRKEEEELRELRARAEVRSLERSLRKEAKGFQWDEKDGPPALPARSPVKGRLENGEGLTGGRKDSVSEGEEEVGDGAATAPLPTRPRRMSTISSQQSHHSSTDDVPPPLPSSSTLSTYSNWITQPLNFPSKAATRTRPCPPNILISDDTPLPLRPQQQQSDHLSPSPGIVSSRFTSGQQQQQGRERERQDEEGPDDEEASRSPTSPIGTYFIIYPPSSSSSSSVTSSSVAPPSGSGSPLDLVQWQASPPSYFLPSNPISSNRLSYP